MNSNPFEIIKSRLITEKASVLTGLQHAESNACLKKFKKPKYVFLVDRKANKKEIAWAVEKIYSTKKVKVTAVNVINVKPKAKRVRGFLGQTKNFKKAIVTLEAGDNIEEQV